MSLQRHPARQYVAQRAPSSACQHLCVRSMASWHACKQDSQSLLPLHLTRRSCRSSQPAHACRQASQPLSTPRMADHCKGSLGKRKASMDLELDCVLNAEVSRLELLRLRQSFSLRTAIISHISKLLCCFQRGSHAQILQWLLQPVSAAPVMSSTAAAGRLEESNK